MRKWRVSYKAMHVIIFFTKNCNKTHNALCWNYQAHKGIKGNDGKFM